MPSPRGVVILHGSDGSPATWDELVTKAAASQAVLVGENHGHPLGLASAAALWSDLIAKAPTAALAMEFVERNEQSRLDDYLAGLITQAEFEKATNRTPGNYPPGHRTMVEAAKAARRPVSAANAPRVYVRLSRTDGYDRLRALTPTQQLLFRIPDELPTNSYRAAFDKVMSESSGPGHTASPKAESAEARAAERSRLDAAFRSQSLWDWTMAESVARSIQAGSTPTMLVVGWFHVANTGGTVQALEHLRPGTRVVTVCFVGRWSRSLNDEEKGRADYVVFVGPGEE